MPKETIIKDKKDTAPADARRYFYAIGRRKTAIARVKLFDNGAGKMTVNGRDYQKYFPYVLQNENLTEPLAAVGATDKFDADIKVIGGGPQSQAEACRLGIARALVAANVDFKPLLRVAGLMTRDPRAKERKKPGLKRARRAPQWAKR